MSHSSADPICAVVSDSSGALHVVEQLHALGRSGSEVWETAPGDLIPLPAGTDLFYAVGKIPVGLDPKSGEVEEIHPQKRRERVFPVAAILPAGFTRLLLPAWRPGAGPHLPLYGYTAVASRCGQLLVAARQTDDPNRWNPEHFNSDSLPSMIEQLQDRLRGNRIVDQLGRCAIEYHCLTAQNLFYSRWEAGIPVSPACNAGCIGCISLQESGCCQPPGRLSSPERDCRVGSPQARKIRSSVLARMRGGAAGGSDLVEAVEDPQDVPRTVNINTNASVRPLRTLQSRSRLDSSDASSAERIRNIHRPSGYTPLSPQGIERACESGVRLDQPSDDAQVHGSQRGQGSLRAPRQAAGRYGAVAEPQHRSGRLL